MNTVPMRDRIRHYLEARPEGASSEELAALVLNLKGAGGAVADRILAAAVAGDARLAKGRDGLWTLKPVSRATPLREATFLAIGVRPPGGEGSPPERAMEIAGCRFRMEGPRERFAEVRIGGTRRSERGALSSFAAFARGTVPSAFRLPRLRRLVNGSARLALGYPFLDGGVCLYRLGRRIFPERPLPALEDLAEAAGLSYVSGRKPEDDSGLQADLLLFLLERYEKEGVRTVEEVVADLYPAPIPVDFEAFAFDEMFLDELPQSPGVYIMRDREGHVIYVGKSVNLRDRVRTYFARRSERPEKTKRILDRIWSVEVETVGSELEALLWEARLIRLCKPEFNTQVEIHNRATDIGPERNFVLVLTSSEPDSLELFCVREAQPPVQLRVRRDLSDWAGISDQVGRLYLEGEQPDAPPLKEEAADIEILRRWLSSMREGVNCVDMQGAGRPEDALRVLKDTVQGCAAEGGERVWRI